MPMPSQCAFIGCTRNGSLQAQLPGATAWTYYCNREHMDAAGAVWTERNKAQRGSAGQATPLAKSSKHKPGPASSGEFAVCALLKSVARSTAAAGVASACLCPPMRVAAYAPTCCADAANAAPETCLGPTCIILRLKSAAQGLSCIHAPLPTRHSDQPMSKAVTE